MTDPTAVPYRDETTPLDQGRPTEETTAPAPEEAGSAATVEEPMTGVEEPMTGVDVVAPAESETDILAAQVTGPEDHAGMAALWRLTMDLPHWWFVAVGEEGMQSPAAADIDGQLMVLAFTDAERARHFAVSSGMIEPQDDLAAIALPPVEVVQTADDYAAADVAGFMFDPQIAGFFIPTAQLPVVWEAVHPEAGGAVQPAADDVDDESRRELLRVDEAEDAVVDAVDAVDEVEGDAARRG